MRKHIYMRAPVYCVCIILYEYIYLHKTKDIKIYLNIEYTLFESKDVFFYFFFESRESHKSTTHIYL